MMISKWSSSGVSDSNTRPLLRLYIALRMEASRLSAAQYFTFQVGRAALFPFGAVMKVERKGVLEDVFSFPQDPVF